jgi:hypothetical protein
MKRVERRVVRRRRIIGVEGTRIKRLQWLPQAQGKLLF